MSLRLLRAVAVLLCATAGTAAVRHARADFRGTATLDEIAKRRESRVPPIAPPRDIHAPTQVSRTRKSAPRPPRTTPQAITTANAPVSYSGFLALLDNFTAVPPDTTGAVGPQHIVTMLNTQMHIQSRTGVARANYPISLNAFWSPLQIAGDTFDPRVEYDASADRWIACAAAAPASSSSALLVAVSQTGDPGGAWTYYKVNVGPNNWGDYPVLGFNGNWIAVSINLFRVRNNNYQGTTLYAFQKADLYRGGTGASVSFNDPNGELVPVRDFDNRPDQMHFVQTFSGHTGVYRLSRLQGRPGFETFSGGSGGEVTIDDGWAEIGPNGEDFAPQLGSTARIDAGDARLQNCLMRGGTIWCAHTVFLPAGNPTRAAVQWIQLDPAGPKIIQRGRLDDPTGATFYAYPSIAVNRNNDMMLGYTRFAMNEHAGAEFAFRLASDPPGTVEPPVLYKRGEAVYINPGSRSGSNRWGDYSATLVDPLDDLTFWTLQEYATTPPAGQLGRFGTWWAKVTAPSIGLRCSYTLSSASQTAGAGSSAATVTITTAPNCPWMAAANVPWVQVTAGNLGVGSGTVAYSVASNANPNTPRTGTITIAGQTFTITQTVPPAGADLSVAAVSAPVSAEPGQTITVSATVANLSMNAAVAFRIGLYLGVGPAISTRDTLIGSCAVPALPASASTSCTRTVALPSAIQPGRYVIGGIADDQAAISDPNTANNSRLSDFGPVTVTSAIVRPALPAQGIVNAASYQGGAIAPGEVITIFGTNLGPVSPQFPAIDAAGTVATVAGGTRVLFDGIAGPMVYALAGQVSAVVPFGMQGRATTQVQVEYLGTRSDAVTVPVVGALPAIFTLDRSGRGPGAILNQDLSVNGPANPAARGSTIVIYATGAGAIPGLADGRLAQPPFPQLFPAPTVRIGGIPAQVTYAGAAPGLVAGVIQINLVVPPGITPGSAAPIDFTVGLATSPAGVTVAIR